MFIKVIKYSLKDSISNILHFIPTSILVDIFTISLDSQYSIPSTVCLCFSGLWYLHGEIHKRNAYHQPFESLFPTSYFTFSTISIPYNTFRQLPFSHLTKSEPMSSTPITVPSVPLGTGCGSSIFTNLTFVPTG
ncbi:hypothetical protein [Streptococcus phage phi-m46.1]|nr:hypothetical protein [Streptococcus phage phi-m46.1]